MKFFTRLLSPEVESSFDVLWVELFLEYTRLFSRC